MDFEMANQANIPPREPSLSPSDDEPLSPLPLDSPRSPAPAPSKRAAATSNGWNALNKETNIASTAAFPTTSTVPAPSRKRKAAAIASQNIASGNSAPIAVQTGSKKGGTSALPPPSSRETNMVTFENCNTTLNKDGHLVSDDGVVFAPNGKSNPPEFTSSFCDERLLTQIKQITYISSANHLATHTILAELWNFAAKFPKT
jgi:hypothetical protein